MVAVLGPEPTKCSSGGLVPEAAVISAAGHDSEAQGTIWGTGWSGHPDVLTAFLGPGTGQMDLLSKLTKNREAGV